MKNLPRTVAGMLASLALVIPAFAVDGPVGAPSASADPHQGLALQIAMERSGFSPGILDGNGGRKTTLAIRLFQESRGMPVTGQADAATLTALRVDAAGAVFTYTVQDSDLAQVGPLPRKWADKAKASRLPYPSLDEALAEKFHCTRALLSSLNGGKSIASLKVGQTLVAPAVPAMPLWSGVEKLQIDLSAKTIRLVGAGGKPVGLVYCSVAAKKSNLPHGRTSVVVISQMPTYKFDPSHWPEVRGIGKTLILPPGPRNPVGMCWMGLGLRGYGIHGTPSPENIGKTGSHGCIRLANWDAVRMGKSIALGTPVVFTNGISPTAVASTTR